MGLESSVTKIADLNPSWPLSTDAYAYGANHLQNVKTAVQSLRDGTNGCVQLGFNTLEITLTADQTVDYTDFLQRGSRLVVILKQDSSGGHKITWASKFKLAGTDISLSPDTYSVFDFVVGADGNLYLASAPVIGAS